MPLEWIPFAAAPGGAIVGAGLTYALGRSRLTVTIDQIQIAPSPAATTLPVPVNVALQQALLEYPEALPRIKDLTAPEATYVVLLQSLLESTEDRARVLQNAEEAASTLRQHAAAEEFERLVAAYKFQHRTLWPWAAGEAMRGRSVLDGQKLDSRPQEGSAPPAHPIFKVEQDQHHAWVVEFPPGVLSVAFEWDTSLPAPRWKAVEEVAYRASHALARHERQVLMEYFGGIRSYVIEARTKLEHIRQLVQTELENHARLQVAFLVSNTGRAGVSLASEAAATILLSGYAAGGPEQQQSDVSIPLTVIPATVASEITSKAGEMKRSDSRAEERSPIVLQAGETLRLIGVSEKLLAAYPACAALRAAYSAAERNLQLSLIQFRQPRPYRRRNRDSMRLLKSRRVLFRDLRWAPP